MCFSALIASGKCGSLSHEKDKNVRQITKNLQRNILLSLTNYFGRELTPKRSPFRREIGTQTKAIS